jgi:hypothetical protein
MSNVEAEVRCGKIGAYQNVSCDDNSEKVVGFRESHCRREAR